jgi:hypothetical protein
LKLFRLSFNSKTVGGKKGSIERERKRAGVFAVPFAGAYRMSTYAETPMLDWAGGGVGMYRNCLADLAS